MRWLWLIKSNRFQAYNSTIHHTCIALCVHPPKFNFLPSPITWPLSPALTSPLPFFALVCRWGCLYLNPKGTLVCLLSFRCLCLTSVSEHNWPYVMSQDVLLSLLLLGTGCGGSAILFRLVEFPCEAIWTCAMFFYNFFF